MIDLTKAVTVFIGRRGEHHYRSIELDVSSLLDDQYPGSSLNAIFKRPDGTAYPVVTNYANGVLTWSPSATDTANVGVGRLEIRVTSGEVVGKSAQILTIVEEALADGIAIPPEPPAQEWLNQVLTALDALDVNDTYNLLNLTYNLLNSNYALLNTTHDLVEDARDNLNIRTGILLNHMHPIETATAPDMISRRASITFTGIANGNNVIIGSVTYTFVTSLGSPVTNTVKKLAEAIRGIQDITNIAYGTGTTPNPTCTAYWTNQRFSIGDITIAAGESLFLLEKAEDVITALTLTSTTTATINAFTRAAYLRYVMSGNASGTGGINSVRGPMQTVLPIGSVVIGGQGGQLYPTTYDCHLLTLCRQADTSEKELDLYISNDEVTFTRISRSTPVGADSSSTSLHFHIELRQSRIPAGYGLYIRMGSNDTTVSAYCDLKFTYHLYPVALVTTNPFDL
jgi:hypothetical protein